MRYRSRSRRSMSTRSRGGPPGWFIMLIAVALVFAAYYLWTGMQNYFLTGGQGVVETTQRAGVVATATAERFTQLESGMSDRTPLPTPTPIPECMDFVVIVANAIVREEPAAQGAIITQYPEGTTVCVLGRQGSTEWYVIDQEPNRRRLVLAYMHETVIRAVNPTATPTNTHTPFPTGTFTPLPTVTPVLSDTPETPVTASPIPPTPTQTPIPSETPIRQAA